MTQKTYDAKCAKLDKTILEQRTKLLDMSGTQTGTQDGAVLHCREDIARLKELSHLRTLNRQTVEKLIQSIRLLRGKVRQLAHNGTHPSAKHSASPKAVDTTRFSGRCW